MNVVYTSEEIAGAIFGLLALLELVLPGFLVLCMLWTIVPHHALAVVGGIIASIIYYRLLVSQNTVVVFLIGALRCAVLAIGGGAIGFALGQNGAPGDMGWSIFGTLAGAAIGAIIAITSHSAWRDA